ncbi:hypothetical protein METBIDRAFT_39875, partial [Metschnikowia bicuspidata var. bicuspidata NRRL YB-4993]
LVACVSAMSRNKEKSQSGLHRYYEQKIQDAGVVRIDAGNRPRKVQSVETIAEAELWRRAVMSEMLAKMAAVNDPSLGADELRAANDALNRIYAEKRAWEHHILSLGGNDYIRYEKKIGTRVRGKTYFGRAKELPEARVGEKIHVGQGCSGQPGLSLAYYGVHEGALWDKSIDASKERVRAEINGAVGEKVFASAGMEAKLQEGGHSQKAVERWLVERKKRELMARLML